MKVDVKGTARVAKAPQVVVAVAVIATVQVEDVFCVGTILILIQTVIWNKEFQQLVKQHDIAANSAADAGLTMGGVFGCACTLFNGAKGIPLQ